MSTRRFLVLLIAAAFLVRLAAVIALRDMRQGPSLSFGSDGVEYNQFGLQLANGNGYSWPSGRPTSFRAPGFPLLLAGLHAVFGNYVPFYLTFCLLGSLAALLTFFVGREVLPDTAARVAALCVAFYPPHVYFATEFASENLFVPLLTLALWLVLVHLRTGSLAPVAIAGLALGWATLTRSFAILIPPALSLLLLWPRRQTIQRALPAAALLLGGFLAVVLPWTMRNYKVHGTLVLVATNGGSTFYGGNNDWAISNVRNYGAWVSTRLLPGADADALKAEAERDRSQWQRGKQWVRTHLAWMPLLVTAKYVRLWLPDISSRNRAYVLLQLVCTTPFLLLVLLGQFRMLRAARWWTPAWLVLHATGLTTAFVALLFWGSPRFRDANASLLMLYAAVALELLWINRPRRFIASKSRVGCAPRPLGSAPGKTQAS